MQQLRALRDAIHVITDVISSLICRPCFEMPKPNEAGKVLGGIEEFLNSYERAVVNVAISAKPATADDATWRGWTILGFEADMCDDLAPFAAQAAKAARDKAKADFLEAHAGVPQNQGVRAKKETLLALKKGRLHFSYAL